MESSTLANLFIVALVIYGTSLHELGHAYAATWLGDPTPGKYGRLTLNPLPHLSPFTTAVLLPFIFFMSSRMLFCLAFTPIDPSRLKRPLRDHALIALAGPAMNFLFMSVLIGILWIPGAYKYDSMGQAANWATAVLPEAALWNLILGVFNLIPLPPLDGYNLARLVLPLGLRRQTDSFARMGMLPMVVAMIAGGAIFREIRSPVYHVFVCLLPGAW